MAPAAPGVPLTAEVPRPLVILPTYDERDTLPGVIDAILALEPRFDILVVDDNSPDGTGQIGDDIAAQERRVSVLHRGAKQGLGLAYMAGFRTAVNRRHPYVFQMDADCSHRPADLLRLLAALQAGGADVAIGSRHVAGSEVDRPADRRLLSALGSLYARLLLGLRQSDLTSGFKGLRSNVVATIVREPIRCRGFGFMIEVNYRAVRAGYRVVEVPIEFSERTNGRSKLAAYDVLEAFAQVPRLPRGSVPRPSA
jgi:dolichol-phosphate mannosyltransferase